MSCHNPTYFGSTTMVVYPVVQGPQSPNLKTFTTDQGYPGVAGGVSLNDFGGAGVAQDGSYLVAACTQGGSPLDPPGSLSGVEISRIVIPLSAFGRLPLLSATPASPVDLPFTCFGAGPQVQVTAYPAADPNNAQVFVSPNGQPTVQATYSRQGSYDVGLDCLMSGGASSSLMVPDSAFPPALLSAEITSCSKQGDAYACTLQVTLRAQLDALTMFSVGIVDGGFPTSGSPQVTANQDCVQTPIASPYQSYAMPYPYFSAIDLSACAAGAVMTFSETVTGAAGATITQPVKMPRLVRARPSSCCRRRRPTPTRPVATPRPTTAD